MNRQSFDIINRKYAGIGKGKVRLTQSTLLLLQDISATKANYVFPVLENEGGAQKKEEIRLNTNDEFVCTELGLYLVGRAKKKVVDVTTDLPGIVLLSYNPIEETPDAGIAEPFYNGNVKYLCNNIVYLEKWDTLKHKYVTRTQFAQRITAGGATTLYPAQIPSNDFRKDAMHPMQPMLTLSGAKKNELSLQLPEAAGTYQFSNIMNDGSTLIVDVKEVALVLRGMNAQNAAKFQ